MDEPRDGRREGADGEMPEETVLITGFDARTREVTVLKAGDGAVEAAVLTPVVEGRPLTGDLVRLTPRPELPLVASLKTLLRHPDAAATPGRTHKGPPRVSSEAYRKGWEAIFGRPEGLERDPDAN